MKNILFILLLSVTTSISAQINEGGMNSSNDNSKDKIYAIDKNFQYLKSTIDEGTSKLTGYYNFDLYKVIEEENGNERTYYYWSGKLLSVYDAKLNKQFFFSGEFKNASDKLFDFYNNRAKQHKSKFDNFLISPIIKVSQNNELNKVSDGNFSQYFNGKYDRTKFNNFNCLIIETSRYTIADYKLTYSDSGTDTEYEGNDCKLTEKTKNIIETNNIVFISIQLKDKENDSFIKLPLIKLTK